ncbi:hypothetical protein H7F43_14645, partial [Streptococcus sp. SPC0]|nr:hypothetical protein [Streptococcus sp. SPC0]
NEGDSSMIYTVTLNPSIDSSKIGQVTFAKVKEINDINLVTNKTDSELMTIIKEKMKVIQV